MANFEPMFSRSASAVTPCKNIQLTLTGSPPGAFQWSSYVAPTPSKGRLKNAKGRFPCKIALLFKKYATNYKVSCQLQSCKAFVASA